MGKLPDEVLFSYGVFHDKRGDFEGPEIDLGWIGENAEGVWIKKHPQLVVAQRPWLWGTLSEMRWGQTDITPEDYRTKSNYQLEAKATVYKALKRKYGPKPKGK
jgi:hypothetical protein